MIELLIVVPVYNEERTIVEIIRRVIDSDVSFLGIKKKIVVVDDGSCDDTAALVSRNYPDVLLMRSRRRGGKGAAILKAVENNNADFILIQDADLEYDPSDYSRLLEPLVSGRAKVVYGSRFLRCGYPQKMLFWNYVGNLVGTMIVNVLYGVKLTDLMTGYKVLPLSLMRSLGLKAKGFDICPELTAELLKRKIDICEVPITYRGRSRQEGKKIVFGDSLLILSALIRKRFEK